MHDREREFGILRFLEVAPRSAVLARSRYRAIAASYVKGDRGLYPGYALLAKRWLLSTHQGSVEEAHLQSYLDEFVFRFNRRRSRSRGLVFYRVLELAAGHDPVRYRDIVAVNRPRKIPPVPPVIRGHPPSLERPPAQRPRRAIDLDYSG